MRKQITLLILLLTFGRFQPGIAQDIFSNASLTLPQQGNANFIVNSGENIQIVSNQQIRFLPGTELSTGSTVKAFIASNISQKLKIASIVPQKYTSQDYTPWLSDDLNQLVEGTHGGNDPQQLNNSYTDITLWLDKKSSITKLSLYDHLTSPFPQDRLTYIYLKNGNDTTFVGTFDGSGYMSFTDYVVNNITADAVIIRKYGNDIPQKIWVYGYAVDSNNKTLSVLDFPLLPVKKSSDKAFNIYVKSNNHETPIDLISMNPSIASINKLNDTTWQCRIHTYGEVTFFANQSGNNSFIAAGSIAKKLLVNYSTEPKELDTIYSAKIPIDVKRWYILDVNIKFDELFNGIKENQIDVLKAGHMRNPFEAYYPLRDGEKMTIDAIKMFDGFNFIADSNQYVRIYAIDSAYHKTLIATFTGSTFGEVGPNPQNLLNPYLPAAISNAKYLYLQGTAIFPTELEFYGTYTPGVTPSTAVKKHAPLRQLFAVNGFEWDFEDLDHNIMPQKAEALKTFNGFRHYLEWDRIEPIQGKYTFSPTGHGGWDMDKEYEKCKELGIEVLGDIKGIPDWLKNTYPDINGARDNENVPTHYGADLLDPNSYILQAKMGFQYAARYGSNKNVNPALVSVNTDKVSAVNVKRIGLNLVKYMECDNERDKTWKMFGYQTGREYAANMSAFYDGHKNTMGPGVGVKNADPNMIVVMGGLATDRTDYVRGMVDWCKEHRGFRADGSVDVCWDVINYHAYGNDAASNQSGGNTRGAAPEVSRMEEVANNFIQMSHELCKDQEVWITETGYDLSPYSTLRAIPIGNKTAEDVQADWILRTSLLYSRAGVQRCFFYILYDQSVLENGTNFATSGLMREVNGVISRKPAADFIYQTHKLFGDYTYQESLNTNPVIDRYELNGKSMYTLYLPNEEESTIPYTIHLANADSAYIYTPSKGQNNMALQKIKLTGGNLTVNVSQTPIFVTGIISHTTQNYTWTGNTSTNPAEIGNWINTNNQQTTEIPGEKDNVNIPSGLSRYPVQQNIFAVKNMSIAEGAKWNLNGMKLSIYGNVINNGSLTNNDLFTSTLEFGRKDSVQILQNNGDSVAVKLGRVIISNPNGLQLNGDLINVYDFVKINEGNLLANGKLQLKASANSFASILEIPSGSAVIGDVITEMFLSGGTPQLRSYRLLSTPINDNSVGGKKTLEQLKDQILLPQTQTGQVGFDLGSNYSYTDSASVRKFYEPATQYEYNYTNVNSIYELIPPGTGFELYFRGNKSGYNANNPNTSAKLTPPFIAPEPSIVKIKGPINQGSITRHFGYTLHLRDVTENGRTFTTTQIGTGDELVGNPYPCAIEWAKLTKHRLADYFYIKRADGGVSIYDKGLIINPTSINLRYIQPGQGFYIQALDTTGRLTFNESAKIQSVSFQGTYMNGKTSEPLLLGGTGLHTKAEYLRIRINGQAGTEEALVAFTNGHLSIFNNDEIDVPYKGTPPVSISTLSSDGIALSMNFMPTFKEVDHLKLNIETKVSGKYQLLFNEVPADISEFQLVDKYLQKSIPLAINTSYDFTIDSRIAASFGANRFEIIRSNNRLNARNEIMAYPNPCVNEVFVQLNSDYNKYWLKLYTIEGKVLQQKPAGSSLERFDINALPFGTYMIEISDQENGKTIKTLKILKK